MNELHFELLQGRRLQKTVQVQVQVAVNDYFGCSKPFASPNMGGYSISRVPVFHTLLSGCMQDHLATWDNITQLFIHPSSIRKVVQTCQEVWIGDHITSGMKDASKQVIFSLVTLGMDIKTHVS